MSQKQMRAVAALLLHHQAFASPPPRAARVEIPPPMPPGAPQVWYVRAWAWLRDRYLLTGWQEGD